MSASKSRREPVAFSPGAPDHYKLLGVAQTATSREITAAYRDAMKRAHPDRQRPERRATAEERAKALNLAYTTLSKAESRRSYDAEIKVSAIQDQIMNRYVGGFAPSTPAGDPFGEALRREQSQEERADQRRADRSAITSILIVFGGITLFVIAVLLIWTVMAAVVSLFN